MKISAQACSSGSLLLRCSLTASHVELISSIVSNLVGRIWSMVSSKNVESHRLTFKASWNSSWRSVPYNMGALALLVALTRSWSTARLRHPNESATTVAEMR
jgi:hypothetical protein